MHTAPPPELQAAFRDLHGRRLHGFALLLTLGDRALAARVASQALGEGIDRVAELRHPERAAAWLRGRVLQRTRRDRPVRPARAADAAVALADMGVPEGVAEALGPLSLIQRAAVIATIIERLDRRDVATMIGRDAAGLERVLRRGVRSYLRTASEPRDTSLASPVGPMQLAVTGPTVERVRRAAERALR